MEPQSLRMTAIKVYGICCLFINITSKLGSWLTNYKGNENKAQGQQDWKIADVSNTTSCIAYCISGNQRMRVKFSPAMSQLPGQLNQFKSMLHAYIKQYYTILYYIRQCTQ